MQAAVPAPGHVPADVRARDDWALTDDELWAAICKWADWVLPAPRPVSDNEIWRVKTRMRSLLMPYLNIIPVKRTKISFDNSPRWTAHEAVVVTVEDTRVQERSGWILTKEWGLSPDPYYFPVTPAERRVNSLSYTGFLPDDYCSHCPHCSAKRANAGTAM